MQVEKELSNVSAETLDMIRQWLKSGAEFVKEQAPDVCQQIVMREVAQWYVCLAVWAILLLVAAVAAIFFARKLKACKKYYEEEQYILGTGFSCMAAAGGFIGVAVCAYNIVSVQTAPKVFILEYLTKLVK